VSRSTVFINLTFFRIDQFDKSGIESFSACREDGDGWRAVMARLNRASGVQEDNVVFLLK